MARVTSLPNDMQSWLRQGGKIYFVWGHSPTDGEKIIGYVRAHDRTYGQLVAKTHGGYLGRKASLTDIAGLLQLGRPELHHTVPVGTPPRRNPRFDGSQRAMMPAVPGPVVFNGYRIVPLRSGDWSITADGKHIGYAKSVDDAKQTISDHLPPSPNPPLVVFGNPSMDPWDRTFYNVTGKRLGTKGAKVLSRRAISIRYVHAKDGQRYEHKFGPNDCIELLPDGSFRIYNKQGKNLWKDFG